MDARYQGTLVYGLPLQPKSGILLYNESLMCKLTEQNNQ